MPTSDKKTRRKKGGPVLFGTVAVSITKTAENTTKALYALCRAFGFATVEQIVNSKAGRASGRKIGSSPSAREPYDGSTSTRAGFALDS